MNPTIIVAVTTGLFSLSGIALAAFVTWFFGRLTANRLAHIAEQQAAIHVLVNSRLTDALKRVEELEFQLRSK